MKRPTRSAVQAASPLPRETLEAALHRVAGDYADFVASWPRGEAPPDPKAFAAHQAAARAALAHIAELAAMAGADPARAADLTAEDSQLLAAMRVQMAQELAKEADG